MCPIGLDTFIKAAQKLPCADTYDVVEGYIRISAECAEIVKLLEEEKKVENKVSNSTARLQHTLTLAHKKTA